MIVAYSLLLLVGLVLSSPWWLVRIVTTQKYREGMRERLGFGTERLRPLVTGKRVAWIHAVSVGEVLAGSRLVAELGEALGPDWAVVISTTTRTGQALARERFGAERVFYLPLDFAWAIRAWMRVLQPKILVLMESEVWPRLLWECKRANIPTIVVNARVSDRSYGRAMKVRSIWGRVLRMVTLWLAQSEEDARRLREMGARNVRVSGNLKFEVRAPKSSRVAELIRKLARGRRILVAGSTVASPSKSHLGEDERVLASVSEIPETFLVLAPRHPERFAEVESEALVTALKTPVCASEFAGKSDEEFVHANPYADMVLLDTIGDLAAVYAVADVAFVGGSLVLRGGHNPLEPAQFGVPVVMGSSYENFRGIVDHLREADAIRIVQNDLELKDTLHDLLSRPEEAKAIGDRGRRVFEAEQGATARAVDAIVRLVQR